VKPLENEGYETICDFIPVPGGNNEYFIYLSLPDGTTKKIFSNTKNDGVVFDYSVNNSNAQKIIEAIKKEL
jgi:hypothetical protein